MAEQTKIKIKRKTTPNTEPSTIQTVGAALDVGEPLFDTNTDRLYIGKNGESTKAAEFLPAKGKNDEYSISTSVENGKNKLTISSDLIRLDTSKGYVTTPRINPTKVMVDDSLSVKGKTTLEQTTVCPLIVRTDVIKSVRYPVIVTSNDNVRFYKDLLFGAEGEETTTVSAAGDICTKSIKTDSIIIDSAQIDNNLTLGSSTKNATQKIYGNLEVTGTLTTKALNSTTTGSTNEFDSIKVTNDSTLVGKVTTGDIDASGHSITADEVTADVSESTVHNNKLSEIIDSEGYANTANNLSGTPSLNVNSTKISVTAGGKTSSEVTVPYATSSTYSGMIDTKNTAGTVDNRFMNIKQILLDMVYPVGSIYMSVNDKSPADFLGGNWDRWGQGRVPVGVGEKSKCVDIRGYSTDEFISPNTSGGEYKHTLGIPEMPSHDHGGTLSLGIATKSGSTPLTIKSSTVTVDAYNGSSQSSGTNGMYGELNVRGMSDDNAATITSRYSEKHGDGSNFINYLTQSGDEWQNSVDTSSTNQYVDLVSFNGNPHTHSVSIAHSHTSKAHTHSVDSHSHSISHSHRIPSHGDNIPHNNMPPYITCFMWRRMPD